MRASPCDVCTCGECGVCVFVRMHVHEAISGISKQQQIVRQTRLRLTCWIAFCVLGNHENMLSAYAYLVHFGYN